jgi:hypothetical protein
LDAGLEASGLDKEDVDLFDFYSYVDPYIDAFSFYGN